MSKTQISILLCFMGLLLSSCSYDTKNNFQSEINRPVKNTGDYTRIGVGFDYLLENGTELDSVEAVYLNEVDIWTDVSKRWERYFIPVVWRVLLTGQQSDSSGILYENQIHSAMSGGLQRLSYSSLEGWENTYFLSVSNKYLISHDFWVSLNLEYTFVNNSDFLKNSFKNKGVLGWQLQPGVSLELGVKSSPFYVFVREDDIWYKEDEHWHIGNEWRRGSIEYFLLTKMRPFQNHEIGLGLHRIDYELNSSYYHPVDPYYFSLSYSYIFDID